MLAGLYVVRCYISCLPRLCSVLLQGEKKHKKWFMNINEQAGIPNLKLLAYFNYSSEGENITRCNFPVPDQEVLTYTCVQSHVFAALDPHLSRVTPHQVHHVFRVLVVAVGLQDSTSAGEGGERKRERVGSERERDGKKLRSSYKASTGTLRVHSSSCDW